MKRKERDDTPTFAEQADTVRASINRVRLNLANAKRNLLALLAAPIPLAEAEARVPGAIAREAERWLHEHGRALLHAHHGHAIGQATEEGELLLPFPSRDGVPFGALCAGDPDAATRVLVGLVRRAYADVTYTVPAADRDDAIAAVNASIVALEELDEKGTDEAINAGLNVEHRPEVVSRRAEAAYQARRATLLEEARAARATAPRREPLDY